MIMIITITVTIVVVVTIYRRTSTHNHDGHSHTTDDHSKPRTVWDNVVQADGHNQVYSQLWTVWSKLHCLMFTIWQGATTFPMLRRSVYGGSWLALNAPDAYRLSQHDWLDSCWLDYRHVAKECCKGLRCDCNCIASWATVHNKSHTTTWIRYVAKLVALGRARLSVYGIVDLCV